MASQQILYIPAVKDLLHPIPLTTTALPQMPKDGNNLADVALDHLPS
jgi:hypothetical protein